MPRFAALVVWWCFGLGWSERVVQTAIREIRAHDTLKENETRTGTCESETLPQQIPALNYGAKPTKALSNECWQRCAATEMAGKHLHESAVRAITGFAQDDGIVKMVIYGTLHATGALPNWEVHELCQNTFDLIQLKCPRGYFKKSCLEDFNGDYFTKSNPKCKRAYDALGKNNGKYRCAFAAWWDSCCHTRKHEEDTECTQCGQDQYFCI